MPKGNVRAARLLLHILLSVAVGLPRLAQGPTTRYLSVVSGHFTMAPCWPVWGPATWRERPVSPPWYPFRSTSSPGACAVSGSVWLALVARGPLAGSHSVRPGPLVPLPEGYWRGPALSPCPRERERVRHPEHLELICYILPLPVPTHIGQGLDPGGADTWTRAI